MLVVQRFEGELPAPATSPSEAAAIDEFGLESVLDFYSDEAQAAAHDKQRGVGEWFDVACSEAASYRAWRAATWAALNNTLIERQKVGLVSKLALN